MIKSLYERFKNNKEAINASWIIIGRIIQMVLSFVVSIFTARYLGPGNYGILNYATAYVVFFTSLCTLGINSVLIKEFNAYPNAQGEIIGTTLLLRCISSFLSSIMIVGIVYVVDDGDKEIVLVSFLCSVSLVFQVADTFNYWFQNRYQSVVTSVATLLAYGITSVYKIVLLILGKSIRWFAFSTSLDYICLAIVLMLMYRKYGGPKLKVSAQRAKNLLLQSYHYILSGMMVAIYGQTDKLMLKQMLDEKAVGYYSLAASISNMWVFVLSAIIDSMTPTIIRLYKEDKEEFDKKNRRLYSIVIYISSFVALMFMLFGRIAIKLLYGEEYEPSADTLKVITWYTMFSFLGVARNAWIICENKQKYLKYIYLGAAILNVILNIMFIPRFGTIGAAVASLITQISTSMILPCFIKDLRKNVKLMGEAFLLKNIR